MTTQRTKIAVAIALLLTFFTTSRAAESDMEERLSGVMAPAYDTVLQRTGAKIAHGSKEWQAALKASVEAVLSVKPQGCGDEQFLKTLCGLRPLLVPSTAMAPTLEERDILMAEQPDNNRPLRRGDIVAFHPGAEPGGSTSDLHIFRIIGLPGESIQLKDEVVYIDGTAMRREPTGETFPAFIGGGALSVFRETTPEGRTYRIALDLARSEPTRSSDTAVFVVPQGEYLVLGDNRDNSVDSRYPDQLAGSSFVRADAIAGRAAIVYASSDMARIGRRPE